VPGHRRRLPARVTWRARVAAPVFAAFSLVLAACGGGAPGTSPASASVGPPATLTAATATPSAGGPVAVSVTLTNDGCPPVPAAVPAGAVTFTITNQGGDAVDEVELLQGSTILGEKENLAPGLSGSFSLHLQAGSYLVSCPGAGVEQTAFVVQPAAGAPASSAPSASGSAAGAGDPFAQAARDYAAYVRDQVDQLVTATQAFAAKVQAGDVAGAKALYAPARVLYERIEPVAESFGDLDPAIDGREDDAASPDQFTGFHRIEKALWIDGRTDGMAPVAQKLVTDVQRLQTLVAGAAYQPAQLANGAAELIDEIGASKITGEEERYSHIDLVDFQGNLDGARQAFELLEPGLKLRDAALAATLTQRFADVQAALDAYRSGDGFVPYTNLSQADTRALAQKVDALAEPLSTVAAAIVAGGG